MSVLSSVSPFLYLSRAFGVAPYKLKHNLLHQSKPLNRYSEILTGINSVLVFLFIVNNAYFHWGNAMRVLVSTSHWMTIDINLVLIAFTVRRCRDVFRANLSNLNELLRAGVKPKSLKCLRCACLAYAAVAVVHSALFMALYTLETSGRAFHFFSALRGICYVALYFTLNLIYVWCFLFVMCASAIRLCFAVLQEKFVDVSKRERWGPKGFRRNRLRCLLTAHDVLSDITEDTSDIFAFYFLIISFLIFVETLYIFTYMSIRTRWVSVVFSAVCLSYYLIQFLAVVFAAVQTSIQIIDNSNTNLLTAAETMSLFGSLQPLFFLSRILALVPLKIENKMASKSPRHLCYSFAVLGSGIVFLIRELITKGSFEVGRIKEPLWSVTVVLKLLAFIICSVLMTGNAVFRISATATALNRFSRLYRCLEIVDYEILSEFVLRLLFTNLFMYFLCFCHSFVGFYNASVIQMLQVIFQYIFFLFINIQTSHFVVFVRLTALSYETINRKLCNESREPTSPSRAVTQMRKMRGYDIAVKNISQDVNSIYMPFLLFYIFWLFMNKIHGFMWITHEEFSWVPLVLYTVCFDGLVVYVLKVCSSSYDEAEKTANYLHELFIDNDDIELKEEIEIFSLQLLHRKVEFNACGFFKLDFSLLYSMVGAVTTYIIILMQFQGENAVGSGNCTALSCSNCTTISQL